MTNVPALQKAAAILKWLAANDHEVKAGAALVSRYREHPEVRAILEALPGARIADVRFTDAS